MQLRRLIDRLVGRAPAQPFRRYSRRVMLHDEVEVGPPRVVSTLVDGQVPLQRVTDLRESERRAVDLLARTYVERTGHFDPPRFSS